MELIEGPQLIDTSFADRKAVLIGPLPHGSSSQEHTLRRIRAAIWVEFPHLPIGEVDVTHAAVRLSSDDPGVPASLRQAERHPKYGGKKGWGAAAKTE
jgi:hypothetical protein